MPYGIRIFCVSHHLGAAEMLDRVLSRSASQGAPLRALDEHAVGDSYASAQVLLAGREHNTDSLHLQIYAASYYYTWSTIQDYGAHLVRPGTVPDAYASLTFPSHELDWGTFEAIWRSFQSLWPVILHVDGSGFDIDPDDLDTEDRPITTSGDIDMEGLLKRAREAVQDFLLRGARVPFVVTLTLDAGGELSSPRQLDHPDPNIEEAVNELRGRRRELRGLAVAVVDADRVETHVEVSTGHAMRNEARFLVRGHTRRRVVWPGAVTRPATALLW
ncbi:hypothetical protein D0T12_12795 [Actinomadura spongiicola]|uniref:Uncharacterized protein n=1 Tax=Actinomadura spongiicola TaxID=2303421 RepID=A0A372GKG9_9ACTN|nr:hypothetical protein [Actinomadura spongiicola]RFS85845.1 hypothetical protein D0T12_12795 [Actinomadura spongiicola]